MSDAISLLAGAVAMGYFVAGLFFLRFWMRMNDGLFLAFAIAFWLLALNQALVGLYGADESGPLFYSLRLIGFVLIIVAIIRKNMAPRR